VKATPEAPKKFFLEIAAAAAPDGYKLRNYKTGELIAQASNAPVADEPAEIVDFGNGVTLIRQPGTALAAADSVVFDTEIGLPLTFQIGQESTDTLTVIMPKVTKETFSLDGMFVTEYVKPDGTVVLAPDAAAESAEKLKEALNALNNLMAELGSLYLQLDTATNNTASSVTNLTKAESSVGDADPISALIDMKAGESLLQLAYNGLPTAFRITTMIVDSIAAANR
jgi:flagellin-like hook-associated protein FlgL